MVSHESDRTSGGPVLIASDSARSPAAASEATASSSAGPLADRLGWALMAVLVLAQFGMFRQFALREVTWSYPPNHDQSNFLEQSYAAYERMLDEPAKGLRQAAGFKYRVRLKPGPGTVILPATQDPEKENRRHNERRSSAGGMMLTTQAALLFCLAGPSRFVALSINFFYFALFQCVLVATVRWLSGRWSVALIELGLLLSVGTPFFFAGGLFDFRIDFIAMCLYGTFLCLVIRSGVFVERNWSVIAGACAVLLFTFRFVTVAYLAGVLGVMVLFFWMRWKWAGHKRSEEQARNALIVCAMIAVVAIPLLVERRDAIKSYYIGGHVSGPEKAIRAHEQGVYGWKSNLAFYPKSLIRDHAGPSFVHSALHLLIAAGILLALRAALGWLGGEPPIDVISTTALLSAAILVPLVALTIDENKTPVVANIMVPPLLLIVVALVIWMTGALRNLRPPLLVRYALILIAAITLFSGVVAEADQFGRRTSMSRNREQIEKLLGLDDRMAQVSAHMGWRTFLTVFDSTSDALDAKNLAVMTFERQGQMIFPQEVLGNSIFSRSGEDAANRLRSADLAVLTWQPPAPSDVFELPFDRDIRKYRPALFAWCRQHDVELASEHLGPPFNFDATVFVRPSMRVQTQTDGWIASHGTTITCAAEVLRQRPNLELWGPSAAAYLKAPPHVTARLWMDGSPGPQVPVSMSYEGSDYHLSIHADLAQLPQSGRVQIELSFESHFVPRQVNGTADDRELVAQAPNRGELRQ